MRAALKFGEWLPDQGGPIGNALAVADNVLPGASGYRPLPSFVPEPSGALPDRPLGAAAYRSAARVGITFAGTAANLYISTTTSWNAAGSGYAATDDNPWSFVQFGQWVIATNGADAPQYFILDESATFAPLPGTEGVNPPRMLLIAVVRDFVVGGVINGDAATLQWSGINNASEWRPSYGQSDYNIAATGGAITAIAGGEYGLVFQEERITRMTYVAGNVIFQFDEISPNIGCLHPRGFAQIGRMCFFLSARGFMACDGNSVTPIGDEKVDRTFLAAMDRSYLGRMSCVADPVRKIVYWVVPDENPTVAYAYSWTQARWSRALLPVRLMFSGRSRGISLDEDAPDPDTFDEGLPFDDPSYGGGEQGFYLFDGTNTLGTLSGANAEATVGFGPLEIAGTGRTGRTRRWRLDSDAIDGTTLRIDARQRLGDGASVTEHAGPSTSGDIVARRKGRTHQPTVVQAAESAWTYMQGLEVEIERGGAR